MQIGNVSQLQISSKESVTNRRKQLTVFFILLAVYALCAFVTYTFFVDQIATTAGIPMPDMGVPPTVLGLANAAIVLDLNGVVA